MSLRSLLVGALVLSFASTSGAPQTQPMPVATPDVRDPLKAPPVDHHAHISSSAATAALAEIRRYFNEPGPAGDTIVHDAEWLLALMDSSGVQRAHVLSVAYWFGSTPLQGRAEEANVRAENDWVAAAAARYPQRLVAFCSVNPLRDYAVAEIDRCAANRSISGLKLHLANSEVDMTDATHVEKIAAVFTAANRHGFPIVMHMWTPAWVSDQARGKADAETVIRKLLPHAPGVPVQLAHMAGGGGTYSEGADQAMLTFIQHINSLPNLYVDIAVVVNPRLPATVKERIAERIRQLGVGRVVYGTDGTRAGDNWTELRANLPLSPEEFAIIHANGLPVRARSR